MTKNKFLITFLILIAFVLLLTFNDKVSAIFQVQSNNDDTTFYNLPDLPEKPTGYKSMTTLILQKNVSGKDYFYLYYLCGNCDKCFFYAPNYNGSFQLNSYVSSTPTRYLIYRVENDEWIAKGGGNEYTTSMNFGWLYSDSNTQEDIKDILYSDQNIYTSSSATDVFFYAPQIWKVNLFKAREITEILPMVNKLVTILLPAGLGIFSTLLVISLIKSKKWRTT